MLRATRGPLHRAGFDIVRYDAEKFPELRRAQMIRERGVSLVLDVGANTGPYARELRRAGYSGRIVSFEPQSSAYRELAAACADDPLWECRRLAIGQRNGEAELHLAGNSSSSSLLDMSRQHLASAPESRFVGQEVVSVASLDSLRRELVRLDDRVYLKIDVQGLELEVLRGAVETLRQVVLVEAELSLVQLYDGAPLYAEVIDHLAGEEFGLLSLEPVFLDPADGRVLQLDGVFGRIGG
jgi:FkbM family methyltransferase